VISRGTPEFWAAYRSLPPEARLAAQQAYKKFSENPAHPGLHLERLRSNPLAWSVRVTRGYRAVALRYQQDTWIWIWIGSHRDFDREFPVA